MFGFMSCRERKSQEEPKVLELKSDLGIRDLATKLIHAYVITLKVTRAAAKLTLMLGGSYWS